MTPTPVVTDAPTSSPLSAHILVRACVAVTGVVLVAIIIGASPRQGIDDLGLYNPIHVWLTSGKWAYPVHGQPDGMSIHPPFRYLEVALLMKAGVAQYAAFSAGPLVFTLMITVCLMFLRWDAEILVAACIALLSTWTVMFGDGIGLRPDAEVAAAWVAGLLGLELSRERGWSFPLTAVAAAVLAYASVLHYFATAAMLGGAVFLFVAWKREGPTRAKQVAVYMAAGAGIILVPYLLLYVLPSWREYVFVLNVGSASLGADSRWANHLGLYAQLIAVVKSGGQEFFAHLFAVPVSAGLPPLLFAAVGFTLWPKVWVFAAASLPLILFVLAQSRKWTVYLYGEYFVTMFGFCLLALCVVAACASLLSRVTRRPAHVFASVIAPVVFLVAAALGLIPTARPLSAAMAASQRAPYLEGDVARAAAKSEIGDDRFVGGRIGLWYVSGATGWYDISSDVLWYDNTKLDLGRYFDRFDYIVDHSFSADGVINTPRSSVSTWYGQGVLKLRGFYIGSNSTISYARFSRRDIGRISGHIYRNQRLLRFEERDQGQSALVTAFCRSGSPTTQTLRARFHTQHIPLPLHGGVTLGALRPDDKQDLVLSVSIAHDGAVGVVGSAKDCAIKDVVRGDVHAVPVESILGMAELGRNRMNFERMRTSIRAEEMRAR